MSLSVSYNQISNGIDVSSLKEVTQQIFQRATAKTNSDLSNLDLTKFNRADLGTELYNGKVDSATARQIAMTNSGMEVNLSNNALNSLKYLSSEASKSIFKNVDGKITLPETKEITEKQNTAVPTFGKLIETADLAQDRNGSNPFYRGELLGSTKKEEKKEEIINIFA